MYKKHFGQLIEDIHETIEDLRQQWIIRITSVIVITKEISFNLNMSFSHCLFHICKYTIWISVGNSASFLYLVQLFGVQKMEEKRKPILKKIL